MPKVAVTKDGNFIKVDGDRETRTVQMVVGSKFGRTRRVVFTCDEALKLAEALFDSSVK